MENPESSEVQPAVFLSLKESIRLSMSRRRVEIARKIDAQVNPVNHTHAASPAAPRESTVPHAPSARAQKQTPSREDADKYNSRLDEAFLNTNYALSPPRLLSEEEMAEARVDAEMHRAPPSGWRTAEDGLQELTITSYSHFIDAITNFKDLYNEISQRYNTKVVCKGVPKRREGLRSALLSAKSDQTSTEVRAAEAAWIRGFLEDHPSDLKTASEPAFSSNIWALLSLMHRTGYPTRLQEWTFNPNVALFFAIENISHINDDGEIWLVAPSELYEHQRHSFTQELAQAHLYCPTVQQQQDVVAALDPSCEGAGVLETLGLYDSISPGSDPCLSFLEPSHFDSYMVNQACVYSISSDPAVGLANILEKTSNCARRLVIPSFLKSVLLQSLNLVNIHSQWLFPDGRPEAQGHLRSQVKAIPSPPPDEIRKLFEQRNLVERDERKRKIISEWAKEKAEREKKHKAKSWPSEEKVSKSSRGILCKKMFQEPASSPGLGDDSKLIDLDSFVSTNSESVAVKNHGSRRSSTRSRRQSLETATIITVSATEGGSYIEDRSTSVHESDSLNDPTVSSIEHATPSTAQQYAENSSGYSAPAAPQSDLRQSPAVFFPEAITPTGHATDDEGPPMVRRAMRDTLNFVSSPLRGMQNFIKNFGSASKYMTSPDAKSNIDSAS